MRFRGLALLAAVIVLVLGTCQVGRPTSGPGSPGGGPASTPGASGPGETAAPNELGFNVSLEPFADVPGGPLAIAATDDGSNRLFVAAQDGRIWSVASDGTVRRDPMVDLGGRLRSGGEQGLLGLALHPTFPIDPRLFVNYTDPAGDTIIASLEIDPNDPDRIDPNSHRQLLFVDQPFPNHNGGGVLFGPDGYLYLSLGDGGSGGDPQGNGQRVDTFLGKVLRIDVDAGGRVYASPPDNPFAGGEGLDEIWLNGLRNPWRLSFDRATGDLWIGDVGQSTWEEVDVARAGAGGLNFGWNVMEGAHCYGAESCDQGGLTLPVTEYGRGLGCTVIGGYVYRGAAYPLLVGSYLFADYCSGRVFAIDAATNAAVSAVEVGRVDARVSAFGEDVAGELYLTTLGGTVFRVVASPT